MHYTTTNYKSFEETYNFFAHFNKILEQHIPNFKIKLSKEFVKDLSARRFHMETNSSFYEEKTRRLLEAIKISFINENSLIENNTYLPLNTEKINNKATFGTLLQEGVARHLTGKSEEEVFEYLAQIITYVYWAYNLNQGVVIELDHDVQKTDFPILEKIKKNFTPISVSTEDNISNNLQYKKTKELLFTPAVQDFVWKIEEQLIIKRWDDETHVLEQLKQNISNISFVDRSLFNEAKFNEKVAIILLLNIRGDNLQSFIEAFKINENQFKEIIIPIFEKIQLFEDKEYFLKNLDKIEKIIKYSKNRRIETPNLEKYIIDFVNNVEEGDKVSNFLNYIDYISKENIVKPHILELLHSSSMGKKDLLEKIYHRYPDINSRSYFLKILEMTKQSYFYQNYTQPLKEFLKNACLEDILILVEKSPHTMLNYIESEQSPFTAKIDYDFCEKLVSSIERSSLNSDDKNSQIKLLQSLLTEEYIEKNIKRIYELSLSLNNDILDPKYVRQIYEDTEYIKYLLMNRKLNLAREENYFKYSKSVVLENGELNTQLYNLFSNQFVYAIRSSGYYEKDSPKDKLLQAISKANKSVVKDIVTNKPYNYTLLNTRQKLDIELSTIFLNQLQQTTSQNSNMGLSAIPVILLQNRDFCLKYIEFIFSSNKSAKEMHLLKSIPTDFWNNKSFVLKICSIMDNTEIQPALVIEIMEKFPLKIQEFFKKFDMKKGDYESFLSTYILKQELSNTLQLRDNQGRVNKL